MDSLTAVNPRGTYLLKLAAQTDLCILNGAVSLDKTDGGVYTSYQANGFSVVDYVLISRGSLDRVRHFEIHPQTKYGDHAILETKLDVNVRHPSTTTERGSRFHDMEVLDCIEYTELDRELQELMLSKRTWEDAMHDIFGPIRCSSLTPVQVYTDGSASTVPNDPRAGAGVYWGQGSKNNRALRVPGPSQTNNRAELYAVLSALELADPRRDLILHADSEYAIRSVAEWAPMRAELGWSCKNGDILQEICRHIKHRGARVHFQWVKAHANNAHNDMADKRAKDGSLKAPVPDFSPQDLPPVTLPDVVLPGLKVTMSLPQRKKGEEDNDLFERDFDLHNEPWFQLQSGVWTQDPSLWHERKRNNHRDRAALRAVRNANLELLMRTRSHNSFWKLVNKWCTSGKQKITVPDDPLADAFESRLHRPDVLPPEFDAEHREAMSAASQLLPTTDSSHDGIFSSDIVEKEVARAKLLVLPRASTAKGGDDASYRDIISIPNADIAAFFSKCIREGVSPSLWNLAILVAVPKAKGPYDTAENVRMIALECCLLKLLTTILEARIREYCDRNAIIPCSQNGFRPGYRTENNAFILHIAAETAHAGGKPLYTAFVDLRNAFPSVDRDILWAKLAAWGIHGPAISWLRTLYSDMRYRVRLNGLLSDEMESDVGILMGDPASPLAFLLYIADFVTRGHADDVKIDGTPISHLEHADDIVLFSTSEAGLQSKLDDLAIWASRNQMQINVRKTVVMVIPRPQARTVLPPPVLKLYGQPLEVKTEVTYVGVTFSVQPGNMWNAQFKSAEKRARFAANKVLFIESHVGPLPPWEGRMLYRSKIEPHLTWGCEITGCGTLQQLDDIEDVQHYFLRRILQVQSRSQLCILFSELGLWPLRVRRIELQLRYLQDVLGLPANHLAHKALRQCLAPPNQRARFWLRQLQDSVAKLGLSLSDTPSSNEISTLLQAMKAHVHATIGSEIVVSEKLDILQARMDFSKSPPTKTAPVAFREYLKLATPELRRALTKVIVCDHSLSIETLRRRDGRDYDIPRELRLCRLCRTDVEEPIHALFECTGSDDIRSQRREFWTAISNDLPGHFDLASLRNLLPIDLLHALLSFENSTTHLAVHCTHVLAEFARHERYTPSRSEVDEYLAALAGTET